MNNETDAASPEAVLNQALKSIQKDHAILDGPVTNRALLLAAAYVGERIRRAGRKGEYSESVVCAWSDLQNDLPSETQAAAAANAEWLHRLSYAPSLNKDATRLGSRNGGGAKVEPKQNHTSAVSS